VSNHELREQLRAFKAKSGWSNSNIATAIYDLFGHDQQVSPNYVAEFLDGSRDLRARKDTTVRKFLETAPTDVCFHEWRQSLAITRSMTRSQEHEEIARRRAAREEERAAYVRNCLAAERKPQRSRFPAGIIPSKAMLDAARGEVRHG
jgi:erythromycin esterase-like protein